MQWLLTRKVWLLNTRKVHLAHFFKKVDIVRFNSKPSIYSAVNIKIQFKCIGSHCIVCSCITLDIHQYIHVLHVPPSQYFAEHLMT